MSEAPNHYAHYPCMRPRIGLHYPDPSHKRLLVVGESHYFPKGSCCHLHDGSWYSSCEANLGKTEREWISTEDIITNSQSEGFVNKAHGIYNRIARQLDSAGLELQNWCDAIDHCTFYNFYQRPAETEGGSICVTAQDNAIACEVLEWIISDLQPELAVIVSSKAEKEARPILQRHEIPVAVTPHPTCRWWNRTAARYAGKKGCEIMPNFLVQHHWLNN